MHKFTGCDDIRPDKSYKYLDKTYNIYNQLDKT